MKEYQYWKSNIFVGGRKYRIQRIKNCSEEYVVECLGWSCSGNNQLVGWRWSDDSESWYTPEQIYHNYRWWDIITPRDIDIPDEMFVIE